MNDHQQAEHSVLEMIHHPHPWATSAGGLDKKAIDEDAQHPASGARVRFDPRGMEDLGGEVTAEDAPHGAICGGINVVLVAVYDLASRQVLWAVREYSTVLDEGLVGHLMAGHEYSRTRPYAEGDDGAVLIPQILEDGFHLRGLAQPQQVADHRNGSGSWGEILLLTSEKVKQGPDQSRYTEGDEDHPPRLHL
ncbi:cytochrome P450, family 89, subfamily A, polypeptide 3 [Actinidia rufa]|uniref:Cytochrome P450, family 89, subfamily A, polypeptide 3 n=1 Tax=Actinidia rufa TaxID=165716 RepID=A0A7J0D8J7_9ERIC|nr:cytochrome P450, family 89, subfamily A, polypeptide 3 [Actinidia rufa]